MARPSRSREYRWRRPAWAVAALAVAGLLVWSCQSKQTQEPSVQLSGNFIDLFGGEVDGVEVCRLDGDDPVGCIFSDSAGHFSISIPQNSDVSLRLSKDGFFPWVINYVSGTADHAFPRTTRMFHATIIERVWDAIGFTPTPGLGGINIYLWTDPALTSPNVPGARFELTAAAGGTLYYTDDQGALTVDATQTGSQGDGGFLDVQPGDWTLTVTHPTLSCSTGYAFAGAQSGTFDVRVRPDLALWLYVFCQ